MKGERGESITKLLSLQEDELAVIAYAYPNTRLARSICSSSTVVGGRGGPYNKELAMCQPESLVSGGEKKSIVTRLIKTSHDFPYPI
jgi:hypothetical protein